MHGALEILNQLSMNKNEYSDIKSEILRIVIEMDEKIRYLNIKVKNEEIKI